MDAPVRLPLVYQRAGAAELIPVSMQAHPMLDERDSMKLRLKGNEGNSLRLRVSRSEMERLQRGESIAEEVRFGGGDAGVFRYLLGPGSDGVRVECAGGGVSILVGEEHMQRWGRESEVGIYETVLLGDGTTLELVLEKDFACLDRPDADNADTFDHPRPAAGC